VRVYITAVMLAVTQILLSKMSFAHGAVSCERMVSCKVSSILLAGSLPDAMCHEEQHTACCLDSADEGRHLGRPSIDWVVMIWDMHLVAVTE